MRLKASPALKGLNPGQTPVIGADQPLYSILKQLQWQFPENELGEDSFLCLREPAAGGIM